MILRVISLAMIGLLPGGCGPLILAIGTVPGGQQLRATVVDSEGGWHAGRIAIIDVSGLIVNAPRHGLLRDGDNPVSLLDEELKMARMDSRIRAVILRLNTPGGTVTASDAMYRQVQRFKRQTGKPVVALIMDVGASGGYYLACAADRIIAYPTSVVGSIGVIMQTISVKTALGRIGVETKALTTGPNKAAGSPFNTLTDEQQVVLQRLVDDFYRRFRAVVRDARPKIPADRFDTLTDGRVLSGDQAVKAGLIDQVGDLYDAREIAKQLAHIRRADLIRYHRPIQYVGSPYAAAPGHESHAGQTQINIAQFNLGRPFGDAFTGFWYLWRPGMP